MPCRLEVEPEQSSSYLKILMNSFQFEDVALNTALYLMDKAKLYDGARGNPILVLRTLSALVNFQKEYSLLKKSFLYCESLQGTETLL